VQAATQVTLIDHGRGAGGSQGSLVRAKRISSGSRLLGRTAPAIERRVVLVANRAELDAELDSRNRMAGAFVIRTMQTHTPEFTTTTDISSDSIRLVAPGHSTPSSALSRIVSWVTSPATTAPRATVLIRLMAGAVFLSEGILKFVYANQGVGRFTKLGFPFPGATATFVGVFEIVGGLLLIAGLFTRLVAIGFSFEMIVAILTTKISLYLGTSPLPLPAAPPKVGIWAVLHESRSDWAQLLCCLFLFVVGAGAMSFDARRKRAPVHSR
jgi:putative oxidoreductase